MNRGAQWRQESGVLSRNAGNQKLLAIADRHDFQVLSSTGAVVWQLLERPRSLGEVIAELATIFGAEEDSMAADVEQLLIALRRQGLITLDSDTRD